MKKQIKTYLATVYVIPYRIANVLYILNPRIGLYIIFELTLSLTIKKKEEYSRGVLAFFLCGTIPYLFCFCSFFTGSDFRVSFISHMWACSLYDFFLISVYHKGHILNCNLVVCIFFFKFIFLGNLALCDTFNNLRVDKWRKTKANCVHSILCKQCPVLLTIQYCFARKIAILFKSKVYRQFFPKCRPFLGPCDRKKREMCFTRFHLCVQRPIPRICREKILYISLLLLYIEIQH